MPSAIFSYSPDNALNILKAPICNQGFKSVKYLTTLYQSKRISYNPFIPFGFNHLFARRYLLSIFVII